MSAALLIDIILWGSVLGVGFIAYRRGPKLMTSSLREGTWDFINVVPRIALGVLGSGYIAAVIPQEVITGWLGPDSGWFGVATAVVAGVATPGGPVIGFSIGAPHHEFAARNGNHLKRHVRTRQHFGIFLHLGLSRRLGRRVGRGCRRLGGGRLGGGSIGDGRIGRFDAVGDPRESHPQRQKETARKRSNLS